MAPLWADDLALTARAMAEESRARMLISLMDARAWTAAELAESAGITRGTATVHLNKLTDAGLVEDVRQGRHRYVRLKNRNVADAVEALVRLSPHAEPVVPRSFRAQKHNHELQQGRTCYRHLAGALGVAVTRTWLDKGLLSSDWTVTGNGRAWARDVGMPLPENPTRALARPCLDWTERVDHAAGLFAELFAAGALDRGWLIRGSHPRSVRLTAFGSEELRRFGLGSALGQGQRVT
ncbi:MULTISPECIES: ArsR/SmtB family transcription factor [Micrococcaceae]|uniref:ArsR/SmtB family transcription factor n=1 Tax=Micrococcaceae TaxID=1268 RepID=UPI000477D382|nr:MULTISPECIES: winged helix-turn-helix domain-containing protein [Micrococcaceae]